MNNGSGLVSASSKFEGIDLNSNCFDLIRYTCTFTVFLGHFITHFGIDNEFLHGIAYFVRGVPVFFFLSGLFIARSLERYGVKEYLVKRAARIFPELWVCVLANLCLILLSLGWPALKNLFLYLVTQMTAFQFYTGEWLRAYGTGTPNGALWTITVDLQFYIVAMLIVRWLRSKSLRTWTRTIIVLILVDWSLEAARGAYSTIVYKLLMVNILPFLWIFLSGMSVYYFRDKLVPMIVRLRLPIVIAYASWQLLAPKVVFGLFQGVRYNIVTTCLLILALVAIGFSWSRRMGQDYSYSFYLYHMVTMNYAIERFGPCLETLRVGVTMLCCIFCVTVVFAVVSHRLVGVRLVAALEKRLNNGGMNCRSVSERMGRYG